MLEKLKQLVVQCVRLFTILYDTLTKAWRLTTIVCYRKRKKQFVPEELKNNKYWAKRCKNNEAAKRSREARRLKENQIAMRARFLEEENCSLKVNCLFIEFIIDTLIQKSQ